MSHYTVTLNFNDDIPKSKSKQSKLQTEIYNRMFRIEWFIKSINVNKKEDIKFKKNSAIITFYTNHVSKLLWAKSHSTKAFKGNKFGNMYLDASLKCVKLQIKRKDISQLVKQLNKDYEKDYLNCSTSKQKMNLGKKYRINKYKIIKRLK